MHLHFTWSPPSLLAPLPLCLAVWQVRTSFGAILHRLGAFQASPLPRFLFFYFLPMQKKWAWQKIAADDCKPWLFIAAIKLIAATPTCSADKTNCNAASLTKVVFPQFFHLFLFLLSIFFLCLSDECADFHRKIQKYFGFRCKRFA